MDKETLIKLAQPAATGLLAISILSLPLIVKASQQMEIKGVFNSQRYPIYVRHLNSCN